MSNTKIIEAEAVELKPQEPQQAVVKITGDVDGFLAKRKEFIDKVSAICIEGKDYHVIQNKKSLAKGGAEKIASIFQWNAKFSKDTEAIEMFGEVKGLVVFKCVLSKGNKFVGEGRGAASLEKNANDANKTLKMAQKSAFIDAVLRASGLSDFFTQDLEDVPAGEIGGNAPVKRASDKQKKLIKDLMTQKNITLGDLADDGIEPGKTSPSEVIDYLMAAQVKFIDSDRVLTDEEKALIDSIEY